MPAPIRISATGTNHTVDIVYDQPLDESSPPLLSDYVVALGAANLTIQSVVVLNVAGVGHVYIGTTERQFPGLLSIGVFTAGRLKNLAGELAPGFSGVQIVNATGASDVIAPALLAARLNGGHVELYFNEVLDPASIPAASAFVVTGEDGPFTPVDPVAIYGIKATIPLAIDANAGDAASLTYTPPGTGKLRDIDGPNNVAAIGPVPIALDNVTATAAGYYGSQIGIEDIYGENNVAQWSNLDNETTGPDEEKIARALAKTDRWINRELKVGGYVTPLDLSSADFSVLTDIANEMAGVLLYEARGMMDSGGGDFAATVAGKMEAHRKHAEEELAELISEGIDGVLIAGTDAVGGGIQVVQPNDCGAVTLYPYPNGARL